MKYETVTLLTPKIRFPMLILCPMFFSPSSLDRRGEGGVHFCHSSLTHTPEQLGIFARNLKHAHKTSLLTFCHTQI